jgi:hypothetical protein
LTEEQSARLRKIHQALYPFDNTPFEQFEADFCRDLWPEREIKIWEWIASQFTKYREAARRTDAELKAKYAAVLKRSVEEYPLIVAPMGGPLKKDDGQHPAHGEN